MSAFLDIFTRDIRNNLHERAHAHGASEDVRTLDASLNGGHAMQQHFRIHLDAWLCFCRDRNGLDADKRARLRKLTPARWIS